MCIQSICMTRINVSQVFFLSYHPALNYNCHNHVKNKMHGHNNHLIIEFVAKEFFFTPNGRDQLRGKC